MRLDRFLVQHSLFILGLRARSSIFPFGMSDHKPILLDLSEEKNLGPIPFQFNPSWIKHEGFHDLVNSVWDKPVSGSPFYIWEEKFKTT